MMSKVKFEKLEELLLSQRGRPFGINLLGILTTQKCESQLDCSSNIHMQGTRVLRKDVIIYHGIQNIRKKSTASFFVEQSQNEFTNTQTTVPTQNCCSRQYLNLLYYE